jgi:hypothetical protein
MTTEKLRTQQIVIDIPKTTAEPWFTMIVQRLILDDDGAVIQIVGRERQFNRRFSKVMMETADIQDPVTGLVGTISVAGAAQLLTSLITTWLLEEYPGATVNGNNDVIDGD